MWRKLKRPYVKVLLTSMHSCMFRWKSIAMDFNFFVLFLEFKWAKSDKSRFAGSTCTCSLITPNHIFTANLGDSRTLLVKKVPLPPKIPSIIFETQDDETIQELASTMDPGVTFSTTDHRLKDSVYSVSTLNLVHQIREKAGELVNVVCALEMVEFRFEVNI